MLNPHCLAGALPHFIEQYIVFFLVGFVFHIDVFEDWLYRPHQ